MKPLLIAIGIVAVAAAHHFWLEPALGDLAGASLSEEAQAALDLRCGAPTSAAASRCRERLERLYVSGSLDPERTLRAHCDEIMTAPWGRTHPAPPRVCVERFGLQ